MPVNFSKKSLILSRKNSAIASIYKTANDADTCKSAYKTDSRSFDKNLWIKTALEITPLNSNEIVSKVIATYVHFRHLVVCSLAGSTDIHFKMRWFVSSGIIFTKSLWNHSVRARHLNWNAFETLFIHGFKSKFLAKSVLKLCYRVGFGRHHVCRRDRRVNLLIAC